MSGSDDEDLSTTTSGTETDSSAEADNLKENADAYAEASSASNAREEFKRLTQQTDAKNAALERDRSSHSDIDRLRPGSSGSDDSGGSEGGGGAEGKRGGGGGENKRADSDSGGGSSSGSESDSATGESPKSTGGRGGSRMVSGQHHDEEMELEMSSDTVDTTVYNQQAAGGGNNKPGGAKTTLSNPSGSSDSDDSTSSDDMSAPNVSRDDMPTNEYEGMEKRPTGKPAALESQPSAKGAKAAAKAAKRATAGSDSESSSTDDSDDTDSDSSASGGGGGAVKRNYDDLRVSADVKELFQYVALYTPEPIALPMILKPFVPDYMPSIGTPDVFVKPDRPDGAEDRTGLTVLDEPAAHQTDTEIFGMQLRSKSKVRIAGDADKAIPCIEYAEKKDAAVDAWIENIAKLHREKPTTVVQYAHPMPDLDDAMQVWPPEFEAFLAEQQRGGDLLGFSADLDVDLREFAAACCALVDIPVHPGAATESLHVFFTLWNEFRSNQHFQVAAGGGGGAGSALGANGAHLLDQADFRLSTPEAIEAAMAQSDHRPTTADGIRQAMENSMQDQRPSTSTHVKHITGNYRPDTAAAIEAVQQMEERGGGGGGGSHGK